MEARTATKASPEGKKPTTRTKTCSRERVAYDEGKVKKGAIRAREQGVRGEVSAKLS